jgi:hypothetical protein
MQNASHVGRASTAVVYALLWANHSLHLTHPQSNTNNRTTTRKVDEDEGLDHSSLTRCPAVMPADPPSSTLIHTSTTSLLYPRTDPPDKASKTPTRDTTHIISRLQMHFAQWQHHLLRICRIKSFAAYRQLLHHNFKPYPPNPSHI